MVDLEIAEAIASILDPKLLERARLPTAAQAALRFAPDPTGPTGTSLTILITDDEQLRRLNRQFLENDEPTDVLSFPDGDLDPDSGTTYLGDIAISFPRAAEQAAAARHPVENELRFLVVHGVLHLLGYDHAEPEDEQRMWAAQEEVMKLMRET
jgi:probable rRNA maturation factor